MLNIADDTRAILQRSRRVAENADFLSVALSSGDQVQIENATDDLVAAYDNYSGQAKGYSSRFGFDEVAKLPDPKSRDQNIANALASVLIDLEMAVVLGQVAQATGEVEGQFNSSNLDEAVTKLNSTIKAIEGSPGSTPGLSRFAFDEVTVSQAQEPLVSPDLPTAKKAYEKQVKDFYDTLLTETSDLVATAFEEISGLNADKISQGVKTIVGPVENLSVGKLAQRVIQATKRAIDTLKGILGQENISKIEESLNKILDEILKGGSVLQLYFKHIYDYDQGQKNIVEWLTACQADQAIIDKGTQTLVELQKQMKQTFTVNKRIITTLNSLRSPLEWILKKFGGTLPLDLLIGVVFLLSINVALFRGMDYADSSSILKWVDGVIITSKRTLGII